MARSSSAQGIYRLQYKRPLYLNLDLNLSVESIIHGYHEYKVVWYNPVVGEDLLS